MTWRGISWRSCAVALLAVALATGCGGGGGGDEAGGGPPDNDGVSGLLPSAPAVGATLQADAAVLRPLGDGSVLHYRGLHVSPGTAPMAYENVVRHVADGGGVREAQSNPLDDGEDPGVPVVVAGGQVSQRQTLPLVDGQPELDVEFIELRSPVRQGDRYVSLDRRVAAGLDLDGDNVQDTIGVALWTDVIGTESVTLGTGQTLEAVRTATRARLQAHYSSDGSVSAVVEVAFDTWYAAGVGIVKTRGDADGGLDVIEEVLVRWDGIDRGLGATTDVAPLAPAGGPNAGRVMPVPSQVVGFDTHAVVLAGLPGEPEFSTGFSLTQLDDRGQIVAVADYRYADLLGPGGLSILPKLLRWGDQLRVVLYNDDGLHLVRLSGTGQQLLSASAIPMLAGRLNIGSNPPGIKAAADGSTLWVSWLDQAVTVGGTLRSTMWLQGFGDAAQPVSPRVALATGVHPYAVSQLRLAAASGRVLVTWLEENDAARQWRYAWVETGSAMPQALGTWPPGAGSPSACAGALSPWFMPGVPGAVTCLGQQQALSAVLDGALAPVLDGADLRLDPLLPPTWAANNQSGATVFSTADGLGLVEYRLEPMWPDETAETSFRQFVDLPWSGTSVDRSAARILARVPEFGIAVVGVLPMGNRLLVVGADCVCQGGHLRTMLVWR